MKSLLLAISISGAGINQSMESNAVTQNQLLGSDSFFVGNLPIVDPKIMTVVPPGPTAVAASAPNSDEPVFNITSQEQSQIAAYLDNILPYRRACIELTRCARG